MGWGWWGQLVTLERTTTRIQSHPIHPITLCNTPDNFRHCNSRRQSPPDDFGHNSYPARREREFFRGTPVVSRDACLSRLKPIEESKIRQRIEKERKLRTTHLHTTRLPTTASVGQLGTRQRPAREGPTRNEPQLLSETRKALESRNNLSSLSL